MLQNSKGHHPVEVQFTEVVARVARAEAHVPHVSVWLGLPLLELIETCHLDSCVT